MIDSAAANSPQFDRRPWGTFTVLDEGASFKVKRIEVLPETRLCVNCSQHVGGEFDLIVVPENLSKSGSLKKSYGSFDVKKSRKPSRGRSITVRAAPVRSLISAAKCSDRSRASTSFTFHTKGPCWRSMIYSQPRYS